MTSKQHIARPAVITEINPVAQTCTIQYADRVSNSKYTCPLPHPFSSSGWGILAMPTKGTRVLVDTTTGERPIIVATIPQSQFSSDFSDQSLLQNISVDHSPYPKMRAGEIAIQSPTGSRLGFTSDGAVKFDVRDIRIEYSPSSSVSEKFSSRYVNTEAHREITGYIKRDLRDKPKDIERMQDKLIQVNADATLSQVGRNPTIGTAPLTIQSNSDDRTNRNPALVERRSLVYEFARSNMAEDHASETKRSLGGETPTEAGKFLYQPDRRDMSRTDVFNLGLHLPNNLIERIEGTAVDIYGNILDINRKTIDFSTIDLKKEHRIAHENALLRRSIKYHFEMNSRKGNDQLGEGDPDQLDGHNIFDKSTNVGYSFSRWAIDVDGEGLTKINIPASSNTGNIPLLTRYLNTHDQNDRNKGSFRDPHRKDIQHIAFGNLNGSGIEIPGEYAPDNITGSGNKIEYHTAYHEITSTASKPLIDNGVAHATKTSIDNTIVDEGTSSPNAGGRSMHANLDGSLELNIGRDVADRKSLVLDTAGSLITRIGKDDNQNSVVAQTDGNIVVQVGGEAVNGDDVSVSNKVLFYVNNSRGNDFHKIEISDKGIFITSAPNTNLVLQSENNLVLAAKGQILLGGEEVFVHGKYADDGSTITGERRILRTGMEIK